MAQLQALEARIVSQLDRRGCLRWLGVAGATSLAGCSLLGGKSGESSEEFELRSSDHLATAVGTLNVVALAVREFQDADDPRTATFDQAGPRERLAVAREAIAEAEGSAEVEPADVTAVRTYATVLEAIVDTIVELLSASRALEEAKEGLRDVETAIAAVREPLGRATAASASAVEHRDRAVAASDSADGDRLAALDAEFGTVRDGLGTLSGYVTGVDGLSRGYSRYLDGRSKLDAAATAHEQREFDTARQAVIDGRRAAREAGDQFDSAGGVATDEFDDQLETARNRASALTSLSAGYARLIDASESLQAGENALVEGAFDAASEAFQSASNSLAAATGTFETGREAAPDEFTPGFERALCRAGHLSTAAGHLETAAAAAGDGDPNRARTEKADAEAARDRLDRC